ncbi:enterochelin esterase [Streptomyces luteolus]|uniref:Enterochelin esterase n=1 Tax=Streptomyces luteolus TaxID=3043615 RepID=A0ABT6SW66_9ACTN|nr:enterochelin esterase [Streptomyces sp. B-S-A12]MDI3419363.1 enterochelin esterase [Streptomyces sp. B-S-A12]
MPESVKPSRPPRVPRPHPVERAVSARIAALAAGEVDEAEFWRAAAAEGTPLVEPDPDADGHSVVTFLWRGSPATRTVLALPNKVADPSDPAVNRMERVPGTDVWHWSLRMRDDWRATYSLCVDEGEGPAEPGAPEHWRWLRGRHRVDPLNSRSLQRRWGAGPISYVELPQAPRGDDWRVRADVPCGAVSVHTVRGERLGNERRVWVYEPPGHTAPEEGLPVLVLFDGESWQPALGLATLLDNLIADGRIPPVAALLPEALDADTRWAELGCDDRFVGFLADELLPWAAELLPLTTDPARTVLAGQSLGGLTAAYAALRAPHRFGNALAQSGSFWWPTGEAESELVTNLVRESPRLPVRFWLSAGEQEWVLVPGSRRLRDALRERGYEDAVYREFNGGHDWLCWRTELADGIVGLLGRAVGRAE